ncbi:hypothetical protein FT663_05188 [Candidozyma haemuli var. vulneris]|uniref:Uncharacterized protein n=1 Tax=Candidozyma haemuli TaxID=45357 RepID=A0A2V1ANS4_9ASCO|nr:hypothetical protein CXQ85_001684 [[Candida] haemuloni]KAF3985224.1 hypothetical protein FT662_05284 [[Candida] haemuloni var. vulneris]KAF3985728.1 hypothetical protein FT663_05188 [[Candida] haemuloni var. vulneris]PVH19907.1 hypothetical protein CXQ85_001684 [[Candida] haemuloni]
MHDSQVIASRMLRSQRYVVLLIFTALVTFLIVTSASAHSYIKDSNLGKSVGLYVDTAKAWANSNAADSSSSDSKPLEQQDTEKAVDGVESADTEEDKEKNEGKDSSEKSVKDDKKVEAEKPDTETESTKKSDKSHPQEVGSFKEDKKEPSWKQADGVSS